MRPPNAAATATSRQNRSIAAIPARRSPSARPSAPRPDGRRDRTAPADRAATTRPKQPATNFEQCANSIVSGSEYGPKRFRARHALGLDPGVDTGSHEEHASKQKIRASVLI